MTLLKVNGRVATIGGVIKTTTAPVPIESSGITWSFASDLVNATTYAPSGAEQSQYGITSATRVASVTDPTGSKPLLKDTGPHAQAFLGGGSLPLPGPLYIPASTRFNGRPACRFDQVNSSPNLYSMLSPQTSNPPASSEYFLPTAGMTPPYWAAILCRPVTALGGAMDSVLGSDPTISATVTVGYGDQLGTGTDWSFACWYDPGGGITPDGVVRSGHTRSANETNLLILNIAEGSNASTMYVYWRDANRDIQLGVAAGTVSVNAPTMRWRDLFFGWIDQHSYLSAYGIRDAALTAPDVTTILAWASPYLMPTGSLPSEP